MSRVDRETWSSRQNRKVSYVTLTLSWPPIGQEVTFDGNPRVMVVVIRTEVFNAKTYLKVIRDPEEDNFEALLDVLLRSDVSDHSLK